MRYVGQNLHEHIVRKAMDRDKPVHKGMYSEESSGDPFGFVSEPDGVGNNRLTQRIIQVVHRRSNVRRRDDVPY